MFNETTLNIKGYRGEPVQNRFYQQEEKTGALAVILPGFGYHNDLPVLFYPWKIALNLGMDVLRLDTAYSQRADYGRSSLAERSAWLNADADAALGAALASRAYQRIILIGKSLGTRAMGHMLERGSSLPASDWIWLTPVLSDSALVTQVQRRHPRSLFAIGTADDFYDQGILNKLVDATSGKLVVIPGADHSLEVPGKIRESIEALEQVMTEIEEFIKIVI